MTVLCQPSCTSICVLVRQERLGSSVLLVRLDQLVHKASRASRELLEVLVGLEELETLVGMADIIHSENKLDEL